MRSLRKSFGYLGESIAVNFLKANNYIIIKRNCTFKNGEIDIVAIKDNLIIFFEVKTRFKVKKNISLNTFFDSINTSKKNRIINSSKMFLYKHNLSNFNCEFDLIFISIDTFDNYKIDLIRNVNLK